MLVDAFEHHIWATTRLIDTCLELTPEQLDATAPGTYGSILDTQRHIVGADAGYLFVLSGERVPEVDEDGMDLAELRAAIQRNGAEWSKVLASDLDPERVLVRRRDDGSESRAPVGIRLAQVIHHGTDVEIPASDGEWDRRE